MIYSVLSLLGGLLGLVLGGEVLVRGAVEIGRRCGLSTLVSGLTILALGTSAPELAVSIGAALEGASELAIANVVGSNLANVALVLALSAVLAPIAIGRAVIRRDLPVMLVAFGAMAWTMRDGNISRIDGVLLLIGLLVYVGYIVMRSIDASSGDVEQSYESKPYWQSLALIVLGVALLALGAKWLVDGAIVIAAQLGVSQAVIGLTVVAVGTSLPEITASIISILRGHPDMAVGNIVGSNIWNTLCVLGTTALIGGLDRGAVGWDMIAIMAAVGVILWFFCWTRSELSRHEGVILLLIYVAYQAWLFGAA